MKDQIKLLRKALNLTQQEFADRIGLKRNSVANYEIGRNVPIDPVIRSICREFNVNEIWLRTGEGGLENMFTQIDPEDQYSLSLGKLSSSENEFVKNAVNYLAQVDPEKLKAIEEIMKACLGIKE